MSMIAGGDENVRNAFRASFREEPSRPNLAALVGRSPEDILEVEDLAEAIARVEGLLGPGPTQRAPDIFDALVASTQHCPEPAASPPTTTGANAPATSSGASANVPATRAGASTPAATLAEARRKASETYIAIALGGMTQASTRKWGATVQLARMEPAPTARVRVRRRSLSWFVAATMLPLALVATSATLLRSSSAGASATWPSGQVGTPVANRASVAVAVTNAAPRQPRKLEKAVETLAGPNPAIPVVDVNSLAAAPPSAPPSSPPRRSRRH